VKQQKYNSWVLIVVLALKNLKHSKTKALHFTVIDIKSEANEKRNVL